MGINTLFTKYQNQILAVLINQSATEHYLSELGRILGKHPGVFLKGINSLEKQSFILSRKKGNQRLFKINRDHPLFEEIKSIVQKTEGVEGLARELVAGIKGIRVALIYGTYAKGALRFDSDIDLLVVADSDKAEDILLEEIRSAEQKLQREINYKIYSAKEFAKKRREKDPFITEILSEPYVLIKGRL